MLLYCNGATKAVQFYISNFIIILKNCEFTGLSMASHTIYNCLGSAKLLNQRDKKIIEHKDNIYIIII